MSPGKCYLMSWILREQSPDSCLFIVYLVVVEQSHASTCLIWDLFFHLAPSTNQMGSSRKAAEEWLKTWRGFTFMDLSVLFRHTQLGHHVHSKCDYFGVGFSAVWMENKNQHILCYTHMLDLIMMQKHPHISLTKLRLHLFKGRHKRALSATPTPFNRELNGLLGNQTTTWLVWLYIFNGL